MHNIIYTTSINLDTKKAYLEISGTSKLHLFVEIPFSYTFSCNKSYKIIDNSLLYRFINVKFIKCYVKNY